MSSAHGELVGIYEETEIVEIYEECVLFQRIEVQRSHLSSPNFFSYYKSRDMQQKAADLLDRTPLFFDPYSSFSRRPPAVVNTPEQFQNPDFP